MSLAVAVVVVATIVAVGAGLTLTLRGFKASEARERPAENRDGPVPAPVQAAIAPHDYATTQVLKRFFDGKSCAICKRPIAPVHRTGLRPGLLNPSTHEARSWEEIPNVNLSAALETQLPLCSDCQLAESFRRRFPDRVVDRQAH